MNRAIARQSSSIVVFTEQACHAGGRGEARRSRRKTLPELCPIKLTQADVS
jgi:hypothetical protein